jgi:hypothetical protein
MLYLSRNGDLQRMAATGATGGEGDGGGEMQLLRDYSTLGSEANSPVRLSALFVVKTISIIAGGWAVELYVYKSSQFPIIFCLSYMYLYQSITMV